MGIEISILNPDFATKVLEAALRERKSV